VWRKLHIEEFHDLYSSLHYCAGDEIEKNEIDGACSSDGRFCDRFLKRPLLTVSRNFMNVVNSVLCIMAIILKANKVNLFVSSVLFVFWYHSPNVLDTPRITLLTR
jgi:hypothetical protein